MLFPSSEYGSLPNIPMAPSFIEVASSREPAFATCSLLHTRP